MNKQRSAFGALAALALATATWFATAPVASSTTTANVTICHRTNSVTNPYVTITVDEASVDGDSLNDNGQGDHLKEHLGPVFDATNPPPPPHNGDQWGDIIPPFDENGDPRPNPSLTLNWPAGQAIFENGCKPTTPIQVGTVAVQKNVINPDAVATPSTFSIELLCTNNASTVLDVSLSLAGGASSGTFDVPPGSICGATEDTSGLANLVSVTTNGPVMIAAGEGGVVTVTNTFAGSQVGPGVVVAGVQATRAPAAAVQVAPRTTG